jgi:hypothetical protein
VHFIVAQQIKRRISERKMKLFIDSQSCCCPSNQGDAIDFSMTKNFHISFSERHMAVFREVFPAQSALGCP